MVRNWNPYSVRIPYESVLKSAKNAAEINRLKLTLSLLKC
jgi:hypothetical protein